MKISLILVYFQSRHEFDHWSVVLANETDSNDRECDVTKVGHESERRDKALFEDDLEELSGERFASGGAKNIVGIEALANPRDQLDE